MTKFFCSWVILGIIATLGLTFTPLAHADDEHAQPCNGSTIAAVAQWAGIQGKLASWQEPDGLIAAAACKTMPNSPDTTIAAIAFDTKHEGPNPGEGHKEQIIALVQADKVVAANRSTIEEDAATIVGRYRIDTGQYILAKGVRAFGVVFTSSAHPSWAADADAENELTLWIREGDHLRPVFGTNLDGWVNLDNWFNLKKTPSCLTTADSEPTQAWAHMTIAMRKTASHGFADIVLTAHIVQSPLSSPQDHQKEKPIQRSSRETLKYDGRSYGINMFRTFWYQATLRHR